MPCAKRTVSSSDNVFAPFCGDCCIIMVMFAITKYMNNMGIRRILWLLPLAVCCVFALQSCIKDDDEKAVEYVKVGDTVPSFSVKLGDGSTIGFTQDDFVGKRSIIVLFTTGCSHCKTLLPVVDAAWREIDDNDGYAIIPVAREGSKASVEGFWSSTDPAMTMPYYLDPDKSAYNKFANLYVPRLYSVNEQGIIDWMRVGEEGVTKEFLLEEILGYSLH